MTEGKSINPQVLDFLYDATKAAPEGQLGASQALDSKLVQIFGPASIVMGLTQVLGGIGGTEGTVFLTCGLLLYLGVVLVCIFGLWARPFRVSWHADALWRRYWQDEVETIKHALMTDIADAYAVNRATIEDKARCVCIALVLTGFEVGMVVAALIWARVS